MTEFVVTVVLWAFGLVLAIWSVGLLILAGWAARRWVVFALLLAGLAAGLKYELGLVLALYALAVVAIGAAVIFPRDWTLAERAKRSVARDRERKGYTSDER